MGVKDNQLDGSGSQVNGRQGAPWGEGCSERSDSTGVSVDTEGDMGVVGAKPQLSALASQDRSRTREPTMLMNLEEGCGGKRIGAPHRQSQRQIGGGQGVSLPQQHRGGNVVIQARKLSEKATHEEGNVSLRRWNRPNRSTERGGQIRHARVHNGFSHPNDPDGIPAPSLVPLLANVGVRASGGGLLTEVLPDRREVHWVRLFDYREDRGEPPPRDRA